MMGGSITRVDIGHGRGWLDAESAASVARIDDEIGRPLDVNSAGRTYAEQQEAWDKWKAGTGAPANLPGTSVHETGRALDTDDRFITMMTRHGWTRPYSHEPWHFEYHAHRDQHYGEDPTMPTPEEVAKAVWNYSMHGGKEMSGGDKVPQETAGERLRSIRRSTDRLRARTLASTSRLRELVDAGKLTKDTLDEVLTILEAEE